MKTLGSLLVAIALLGATACSKDEPPGNPAPQVSPEAAVGTIAYLEGHELHLYDVDGESDTVVARLPSDDVAVNIGGDIFVVTENPPPPNAPPEKGQRARLLIGGLEEGGSLKPLAPGHSPVLSPDGSLVAAIAYAKGTMICSGGENCLSTDRIEVYEPGGKNSGDTAALGTDAWRIVGWSGDRIVGAAGLTNGAAAGVPGNEFEDIEILNVTTEALWGVSPSDDRLMTVDEGGAHFQTFQGEPGAAIPIDASDLGAGAWSPDGKWIAAIAAQQPPSVVVIDVEDESATTVGASTGAMNVPQWTSHNAVVWGESSERFAFVREANGSYEVVVCEPKGRCRTEMTSDKLIEVKAIA